MAQTVQRVEIRRVKRHGVEVVLVASLHDAELFIGSREGRIASAR